MSLRELIVADAANVFLNRDDFAEYVTYHPRSGTARTITAVVIREQQLPLTEADSVMLPQLRVWVANDDVTGIGSECLDIGGDQIAVAVRIGKVQERRQIVSVEAHDDGMLELVLR